MARKPGKPREIKQKISILVDGECEQIYLNAFKNHESKQYDSLNKIHLKPDLFKKKSLEDQYELLCDHLNNFDKVIWLVDYDHIKNHSLEDDFQNYQKKLIKEAERLKKPLHILINNPSLEFWYLLHFQQTAKLFTMSGDIESKLKKNHIPDYDKTKKYQQGMYKRLKENLPTALKNAKLLSRDMPIGARADIADLFSDAFNMLIKKS